MLKYDCTPQLDHEKHLIEIVLGGWENTKSVIRHGKMNGVALTEASTTDLLHCGEYRMFWIHWRFGMTV